MIFNYSLYAELSSVLKIKEQGNHEPNTVWCAHTDLGIYSALTQPFILGRLYHCDVFRISKGDDYEVYIYAIIDLVIHVATHGPWSAIRSYFKAHCHKIMIL